MIKVYLLFNLALLIFIKHKFIDLYCNNQILFKCFDHTGFFQMGRVGLILIRLISNFKSFNRFTHLIALNLRIMILYEVLNGQIRWSWSKHKFNINWTSIKYTLQAFGEIKKFDQNPKYLKKS